MSKFQSKMTPKRVKDSLRALPSMGIAFVVLGVILLTASFVIAQTSNMLLFTGLALIIAGSCGYIYSIKKGQA